MQYFQFDHDGNMYVFPPGSGTSGVPKLVKPGDELNFSSGESIDETVWDKSIGSSDEVIPDTQISQSSTQCSYHTPLKELQIGDLSRKNFSPETQKKMKWVVGMYTDWRNYRNSSVSLQNVMCDLHDKSTISEDSLNFAIPRFITEVKKQDGSDFPGRILYDLVICIQFHLKSIGCSWKLLNHNTFKEVRFSLDNMMKLRTSQGIGITVRKAEVLIVMEEDILWSSGLLGCENPEMLLNTVVFVIGEGFALRAGKEHHKLRSPPFQSQFSFHHDQNDVLYIRYTEDIGLKTNKGSFKHRKVEPKQVDLYSTENLQRCPIAIINYFLSKLPEGRQCKAFYLQPRKKFHVKGWYLDRPAGANRLRDTVKELCVKANILGFHSNHSLRSTSATKLYQKDVDEKLIQEITGHRSLAVRSYKRTPDRQCKYASNLLFSS